MDAAGVQTRSRTRRRYGWLIVVVVGLTLAGVLLALVVDQSRSAEPVHRPVADSGQCSVLARTGRPATEWIDPNGRLTITKDAAGAVAVAYGMASRLDPANQTATIVSSALNDRLDGEALPLITAESEAFEEVAAVQARC